MSSDTNPLPEWRVNNGFVFTCDSGGLADLINNIPKDRKILSCRFWWCPMNQSLLRLMIYKECTLLVPSQEGAERLRDNIYQIYETCKKIADPEKQNNAFTAISMIFPCVIEDITDDRYVITVSINIKGLDIEKQPPICITILDRSSATTQTFTWP